MQLRKIKLKMLFLSIKKFLFETKLNKISGIFSRRYLNYLC